MKKWFFVFFSIVSVSLISQEIVVPGFSYFQDLVDDKGNVIQKGRMDCVKRLQLMAPILEKFHRPIKVLDIGSSQGFFSFEIHRKYHAFCVMIDSFHINRDPRKMHSLVPFINYMETYTPKNMVFLDTYVFEKDLRTLLENEYFDVILALDVLHYPGFELNSILDLLCKSARVVIVESGVKKLNEKLLPLLGDKKGFILGSIPTRSDLLANYSHHANDIERECTLFCFTNDNPIYINSVPYDTNSEKVEIVSDAIRIETNKKEFSNTTLQGINMQTYKRFKGRFFRPE